MKCKCGHAKGMHERIRPDGTLSTEKWCKGNDWTCECKEFVNQAGGEE